MQFLYLFLLWMVSITLAHADASKVRSKKIKQRYRKQLTPQLINKYFDTKNDTVVVTKGGANFKTTTPDSWSPMLYSWSTDGNLPLTLDEAQIICATNCKRDSRCKVVGIMMQKELVTGLKKRYKCNMFGDARLGPGAHYLTQPPLNPLYPFVVFTKKNITRDFGHNETVGNENDCSEINCTATEGRNECKKCDLCMWSNRSCLERDEIKVRSIKIRQRYRKQLTRQLINEHFDMKNNTVVATKGIANFKSPDYWSPLLYSWSTDGNLPWTFDEAQIICATKCKKDRKCKVVDTMVVKAPLNERQESYKCNMFGGARLGPGAHYLTLNPGHAQYTSVTFTKKLIEKDFDDYKGCDVDQGETDLGGILYPNMQLAVTCLLDPSNCPVPDHKFHTEDFSEYIAPAIICMMQEGLSRNPEVLLAPCNQCLVSTIRRLTMFNNKDEAGIPAKICSKNREKESLIRYDCQTECSNNGAIVLTPTCEKKMQTALLCTSGGKSTTSNCGCYDFGGLVNYPYICPS